MTLTETPRAIFLLPTICIKGHSYLSTASIAETYLYLDPNICMDRVPTDRALLTRESVALLICAQMMAQAESYLMRLPN